MTVLVAVAALGGITLVLAIVLAVANRKLYVYEDPRIDIVEDMLPHANCGACGYPGCKPFAEALTKGETNPGKCTVSSEAGIDQIANYLGLIAEREDKKVARLACAGGSNVARNRAKYEGIKSCQAASLISGGGKGCFWGCLGFGDCETVCDFNAITMDEHGLPVVNEEKCTACGDCVEVCPKDLFALQYQKHQLLVACKNLEAGDEILEECEVACTACGRCAMDAPNGMIKIESNLAVIDYSNYTNSQVPIERCPTGAIVWQDNGFVLRGTSHKSIIRKESRPLGSS